MVSVKHLICSLIIFASLVGCAEEGAQPLRLGTNVWPGYEPLYVARDLELYPKNEIKLVEYLSASEVIRSFRNGNIDAAALTLDEALRLLERGIEIKIILICDFSNGGDVILGNASLKSLKDLAGKTVGVEGNALGAFTLMRAFEIHNLSLEDITLVDIPADEHADALVDGRVDAIVTFDPVRIDLLKSGANELFSSREIPGEIVDVIVVRSGFLETHKKQILHLTNAWFQSLKFVNDQPLKAAKLMDNRLKIGPENVVKSLKLLSFPSRATNIDFLISKDPKLPKIAQRLSSFMVAHGLLATPVPVNSLFEDNLPHLRKE